MKKETRNRGRKIKVLKERKKNDSQAKKGGKIKEEMEGRQKKRNRGRKKRY